MSKAERTKSALLEAARTLFWSRGFSNVSLREIAKEAGVDVALVSRYFGSKQGLFEATIADMDALEPEAVSSAKALVELLVELFATAERDSATPSPVSLILMNAKDPEVGHLVRSSYHDCWQKPLQQILGSPLKAARFSAAMLGMSVAEKTLLLEGVEDYRQPAYRDELRQFLLNAIRD